MITKNARLFILLLCVIALSPATWAQDTTWLFTSFRGNGDGLHLAASENGRVWKDTEPIYLTPTVGGKLLRDPHILPGPDGTFHLVWTTGWKDQGIGYATSKDLKQWSEQRFLAVMKEVPGARNCWAPETFYDSATGNYLITWSSDVEGKFPQTASPDRMNNRTWFVTTKDFQAFSKPKVLFDPGFDNIDATLIPFQGKFKLVIKEGDKQGKNIWGPIWSATGDSPLGPFTLDKTPIITQRAEGPALVTMDDGVLLYVDYYNQGRYGVYQTRDWKTWTDISDQCSVAAGQRHGTIFSVTGELAKAFRPAPDRQPPAAALPGLNADPHIAVFGDTYYIYPTTDGTEGWLSTSFRCWSSRDLKNWKDEGVILDLPRDLLWASERAWAPAIAGKNGKYYYYYSADKQVGVAVADKPTGPFKDPVGQPLVYSDSYNCQSIDPMVFIDDDGAAYLYFGQGKCYGVRLNDNMISFDKKQMKQITLPGYNEGPFMLKRKGTYYLMWSEFDTRDPRYCVAYATAQSPLGPFVKAAGNPILKQSGLVKGAGHHSVVQIPGKDEWVIAYHRFRVPNGNGYNRETCLSPMRFDDQGNIMPVDVFETVTPIEPK